MKFTVAAVAALAVGVSAGTAHQNVTYTTEVVTELTTFCPGPTEISHNGKTYTITEATTLTITDCPCTVTKPVETVPVTVCNTCNGYNTTVPATQTPTQPKPTGGPVPSTPAPEVPTAGAAKAAGLSGAALAAVLGLAALL